MDKKIITVLLIVAIVISVFSIAITLNLNTDNIQLERTTTIIKTPDVKSGNIGFVVEESSHAQNG